MYNEVDFTFSYARTRTINSSRYTLIEAESNGDFGIYLKSNAGGYKIPINMQFEDYMVIDTGRDNVNIACLVDLNLIKTINKAIVKGGVCS